jgi:lipopolysaccharide biosynthesis protein
MWYKALQHTALGGYDALCLANDSCILFRSLAPFLQWADGSPCHYCGITDSSSISYHVQSYFVLVKKPALAAVSQYFSRHGIVRQLDDVIRRYEIGLSTHLLKENLAVGALFNHQAYLPNGGNPAYHAIAPLIRDGIPLIKKRIVYGTHRKSDLVHLKNVNLDPAYYLALIREATSPEEARVFNHDLLFKQESTSFFRKLFYR